MSNTSKGFIFGISFLFRPVHVTRITAEALHITCSNLSSKSVSICCCSSSGLLPNAVLPPSLDHNYAQWQERQELCRAEQPHFLKKIIPAPQTKAPGEPNLPAPSPPLPPSLPPPPALLPGEAVNE